MSEAARLERETEETRAALEGTLDELRGRITPGQMVDQLMERAREGNAGAFVRNFGQQVAANPIPVAVIGVGLAWLMMANKHPQSSAKPDRAYRGSYGGTAEYLTGEEYSGETETSDADYPEGNGRRRLALRGDPADRFGDAAQAMGERMGDAADRLSGSAQAAGEAMQDAADQTKAKLGSAAASVKDSLQHGASSAGQTAKRAAAALQHSASEAGLMTRKVFDFCKEQPLVLAGLGLALGAALGAAFPATRTEDELVGDASDAVKRRASDLAGKVGATAAPAMKSGAGDAGDLQGGYGSQADFAAGAGAGGDLPDPTADPDARDAARAQDAEWPGGSRPQQEFGTPLQPRGAE